MRLARAALILVATLAQCGCLPPTPGIIYWRVCIAYGPRPVVQTVAPDGRVIEQHDVDSDQVVEKVMQACR